MVMMNNDDDNNDKKIITLPEKLYIVISSLMWSGLGWYGMIL